MSDSPDPDKLTDGEDLFTNGPSSGTQPAIVPSTNHHVDDQVQKGVESVLYSDVSCLMSHFDDKPD